MARRVLAIFLDGYEHRLGVQLQQAGAMPAMAELAATSARFELDHGAARRTGLAGEHVAAGQSPDDMGRWAAVHFDPRSYRAWQQGTSATPFPARLRSRTVVVDPPYFDIARAPEVRGIVGWGAHDPGVRLTAQPASLAHEVAARVGSYPGAAFLYGSPWRSVERTVEAGRCLAGAVRTRTDLARWLLTERLPDWDLALVSVSEPHSAIEGMWHGIDSGHLLHDAPSAAAAGDGVRAVYEAVDALVGDLVAALPDAAVVVFALHGMGINGSDIPSMVLLPELLHRAAFGRPLLQTPAPGTAPEGFRSWVEAAMPPRYRPGSPSLRRRVTAKARAVAGRGGDEGALRVTLDHVPAFWYAPLWPRMPVFALPSFYDGRVRVNLAGRERRGVVGLGDYDRVLTDVERLLAGVRDPVTGEPVVLAVERTAGDPLRRDETEADLMIVWRDSPTAFHHPDHGTIGPAPYGRTGGHTGGDGFAYVRTAGVEAGDRGRASAFDVVPTLVELLGEPKPDGLSGASLLARG